MCVYCAAYKGDQLLEEFNVKVLFDKLEDQNLHLASQLARHQDDVRNFYSKICAQNDELKDMLNNLDLDKLEELEKKRAQLVSESNARAGALAGGAGDNINVVGANLTLGGSGGEGGRKYRFAGGSREQDLMRALQLMLDRVNSGNIAINPEMISRSQKEGDTTHHRTTVAPGVRDLHENCTRTKLMC